MKTHWARCLLLSGLVVFAGCGSSEGREAHGQGVEGATLPGESDPFSQCLTVDDLPAFEPGRTRRDILEQLGWRYKYVAMVMAEAQRLGVTKIGIVGNEKFMN